jgi:hypothetical protein
MPAPTLHPSSQPAWIALVVCPEPAGVGRNKRKLGTCGNGLAGKVIEWIGKNSIGKAVTAEEAPVPVGLPGHVGFEALRFLRRKSSDAQCQLDWHIALVDFEYRKTAGPFVVQIELQTTFDLVGQFRKRPRNRGRKSGPSHALAIARVKRQSLDEIDDHSGARQRLRGLRDERRRYGKSVLIVVDIDACKAHAAKEMDAVVQGSLKLGIGALGDVEILKVEELCEFKTRTRVRPRVGHRE